MNSVQSRERAKRGEYLREVVDARGKLLQDAEPKQFLFVRREKKQINIWRFITAYRRHAAARQTVQMPNCYLNNSCCAFGIHEKSLGFPNKNAAIASSETVAAR